MDAALFPSGGVRAGAAGNTSTSAILVWRVTVLGSDQTACLRPCSTILLQVHG